MIDVLQFPLTKRMRAPQSLLDATNTVSIGDHGAVADAIDRNLEECFGAGSFDRDVIAEGPDGLKEREPITTTRNLASIYCAHPPARAH